jgi:hypothetical protein
MSHSLCVMGVYDEVKMTVPMIVHYVHNDKIKEKRNITPFSGGTSMFQVRKKLHYSYSSS